jgi:hypothetical protein
MRNNQFNPKYKSTPRPSGPVNDINIKIIETHSHDNSLVNHKKHVVARKKTLMSKLLNLIKDCIT